jgi:hypothetical protein
MGRGNERTGAEGGPRGEGHFATLGERSGRANLELVFRGGAIALDGDLEKGGEDGEDQNTCLHTITRR